MSFAEPFTISVAPSGLPKTFLPVPASNERLTGLVPEELTRLYWTLEAITIDYAFSVNGERFERSMELKSFTQPLDRFGDGPIFLYEDQYDTSDDIRFVLAYVDLSFPKEEEGGRSHAVNFEFYDESPGSISRLALVPDRKKVVRLLDQKEFEFLGRKFAVHLTARFEEESGSIDYVRMTPHFFEFAPKSLAEGLRRVREMFSVGKAPDSEAFKQALNSIFDERDASYVLNRNEDEYLSCRDQEGNCSIKVNEHGEPLSEKDTLNAFPMLYGYKDESGSGWVWHGTASLDKSVEFIEIKKIGAEVSDVSEVTTVYDDPSNTVTIAQHADEYSWMMRVDRKTLGELYAEKKGDVVSVVQALREKIDHGIDVLKEKKNEFSRENPRTDKIITGSFCLAASSLSFAATVSFAAGLNAPVASAFGVTTTNFLCVGLTCLADGIFGDGKADISLPSELPRGEIDAFFKGEPLYDDLMNYAKKAKTVTGLVVEPLQTILEMVPEILKEDKEDDKEDGNDK